MTQDIYPLSHIAFLNLCLKTFVSPEVCFGRVNAVTIFYSVNLTEVT